ncbi:MAG: hypothetical protein IPK82_20295 [Polyangiaceae bacterium]|nr:hypothetical protein [Polyangiaceae bacterium]
MGTLVALRLFFLASPFSRQHVGMGSFGACTHIALRFFWITIFCFYKARGV